MATLMKGPFVNMNGATRESLMQQAFDVSGAAEALIQALGRAAPHGRDYQTVGQDKFAYDRDIWFRYVEQARNIFEEYRGVGERLFLEGEENKRHGRK